MSRLPPLGIVISVRRSEYRSSGVWSMFMGRKIVVKDLNQHMTAAEYRRLHGADTPEKKRPKVMRIRNEYNGVMYDSRLEADMAKSLDRMYYANIIIDWRTKIPFELDIKTKKGN